MISLIRNLLAGIGIRCKKLFQSPYRSFNISWINEKILKHDTQKSEISHLYKNQFRIFFTDRPAFLLSVREIFIERLYDFNARSKNPRIIDCGGHIGMSALFFLENYPNCRLTVFEPDSNNYKLLQKNIQSWNFSNAEVIQAAVWTQNGTVSFQSNNDMSSSINQSSQPNLNSNTVTSIRLSDWLDEKIDFLKIDIEGAEFDVLNDCKEKLKNVETMFLESHGSLEETEKLTDLFQLLTHAGFKYYITEAGRIHTSVFKDRELGDYKFDQQLNIFCFRD